MPDVQILGFSDRVWKEAREFFENHPVFEMDPLEREIAVEGPGGEMVEVLAARCIKCGFTLAPADSELHEMGKLWPADALVAVKMRHAWDKDTRATYCGGAIVFDSAPAA